jgi:preprotein translocase subunit YajC
MNIRPMFATVFAIAFSAAATAAFAQDAPPAPPASQNPSQGSGSGSQHSGRSGYGGGGFTGHGILGAVTEVAASHYSVKTDAGETYTVYFSANTRIVKQTAEHRGSGAGGQGRGEGAGGGNPPQTIKATDIKVGDAIAASGEVDATAKSVGAVFIVEVDPERAKQLREAQANYGKTWLMGKVTAIADAKVTLQSAIDNTAHTFVADENTAFRKRREPITLADIQVGDSVRAEGAVKDGVFVAVSVNVMGMPPGGTPSVPRESPPPPK